MSNAMKANVMLIAVRTTPANISCAAYVENDDVANLAHCMYQRHDSGIGSPVEAKERNATEEINVAEERKKKKRNRLYKHTHTRARKYTS